MTEYFEAVLPMFLNSGVSLSDFDNMTYGEIVSFIEYSEKKEIGDMKQRALFDYTHAGLVASFLAGKRKGLQDSYEWLFDDEDFQSEESALLEEQRLYRYFDRMCGGVITVKNGGEADGRNDA